MKIETQGKAIELLYRALPYSEQIKDINLEYKDSVRFHYRGINYRIDLAYGRVEEVGKGVLIGTDMAMLVGALVKSENVKPYLP